MTFFRKNKGVKTFSRPRYPVNFDRSLMADHRFERDCIGLRTIVASQPKICSLTKIFGLIVIRIFLYVYGPCSCGECTYIGETHRKWETRRMEHQNKVRLTNADIAEGNIERETERITNERIGWR